MKTFVVSHDVHLREVLSDPTSLASAKVFCANPALFSSLKQRAIPFIGLDEYLIKEHWERINVWACGKSASWIRLCKDLNLFRDYDLPSSMYLFFSHMLAQGLKNYFYAKHILKESSSDIVLFDVSPKSYPAFSGSCYLNYFLERLAIRAKFSITKHSQTDSYEKIINTAFFDKSKIRRSVECIYLNFSKNLAQKRVDVLALGSQRHLLPLMIALRRRGSAAAFLDEQFNWEIFSACRKEKIPYLLNEMFASSKNADGDPGIVSSFKNDFGIALQHAASSQFFIFESEDLSEFVAKQIFSTADNYFVAWSQKASVYQSIFKQLNPNMILTEDDYALKGGVMAACARHAGIPVTCISHAHSTMNFSVPKEDCVFRQSTTIVNSEHERESYVARGWNPAGFKVLGIPRYDVLIKDLLKHKKTSGDKKQRIRLLFCANTYLNRRQSPDDYGYIGEYLPSFTDIVRPNALALFEAIRNLPIEVILKPHNLNGLADWKQMIKASGVTDQVKIIHDKRANITKWIKTSDALVLSYWSTTIIEAAIFGIPILYLNLVYLENNAVEEYSNHKILQHIRTKDELKKTLADLRPFDAKDISPLKHGIEYYLGIRDAKSVERVTDFIISSQIQHSNTSAHV